MRRRRCVQLERRRRSAPTSAATRSNSPATCASPRGRFDRGRARRRPATSAPTTAAGPSRSAVRIVTSRSGLQSNRRAPPSSADRSPSARRRLAGAVRAARRPRRSAGARPRGVIEYDFDAGVVKLTDQVWFSNGKDEFRGDVVIYNVRDERVQINPGGQSPARVHQAIIRPRQGSQRRRRSRRRPHATAADSPSSGA